MNNNEQLNKKCNYVFNYIHSLIKKFLKNADFSKLKELSKLINKTNYDTFENSIDIFFQELEEEILRCQASDKKEIKQTIQNLESNSDKIISHVTNINQTSLDTLEKIKEAKSDKDLERYKEFLNSTITNFVKISEQDLDDIKKIKQQLSLKLEEVIAIENELEQIRSKIYTDELTGLLNRKGIIAAYNSIVKNNKGKSNILEDCIMFIDIDNFKAVNDTFGHVAGDLIIKTVAKILKSTLRADDLVGRIYGDEFVIIFRNIKIEVAKAIAERIREKIAKSVFYYKDNPIKITISAGLCRINRWNSFEETIETVDKLMYNAKKEGNYLVCL